MALDRVTITIPPDLLKVANGRAKALDRSRSWVVAEALRVYLGFGRGSPRPEGPVVPGPGAGASAVRESAAPVYAAPEVAAEIAEARRRRLAAELSLPPEERLRRAEELGRLGRAMQPRGRRLQMIGFDSYEDYYAWRKIRLVGG
jgi:hypothetical protein